MNTNEFDEREWQAQERARLAARDGTGPAGDPLAARYRRVAESLRAPLPDALPADFAAQMARRVQVPAPVAATPVESRFELGLTRALVGVFGLAGAVVAAMYGAQWLPPILDVLHLDSAAATNWAMALGACVGASWLVDQLRRHHGKATHAA
jgi:hypothetical protein